MPRKTPQTQALHTKVTYLAHLGRDHAPETQNKRGQNKRTMSARLATEKAKLRHMPSPSLGFYLALYHEVGAPHHWISRKLMSPAELASIIHDPKVEIHVLYADQKPIGFFELDFRKTHHAEIAFFGLIPQYVGKGYGTFLIQSAIKKAWREPITKLTIETCTLDHPAALPLYKKHGFRPYEQKDHIIRVPIRDPESGLKTSSSAHV